MCQVDFVLAHGRQRRWIQVTRHHQLLHGQPVAEDGHAALGRMVVEQPPVAPRCRRVVVFILLCARLGLQLPHVLIDCQFDHARAPATPQPLARNGKQRRLGRDVDVPCVSFHSRDVYERIRKVLLVRTKRPVGHDARVGPQRVSKGHGAEVCVDGRREARRRRDEK